MRVPGSEALEQQQALLLSMLRQADGAPVSYSRLQEAGIEFPASVVFELELAGVEVERCHARAGSASRVVGVRLDPARDPGRPPAEVSAGEAARSTRKELSSVAANAVPVSLERVSRGMRRLSAWPSRAIYTAAWSRRVNRLAAQASTGSHAADGSHSALRPPRADSTHRPGLSARWLAPLALLIGCPVAVLLIVLAAGGSAQHRAVGKHHPRTSPAGARRPAASSRASSASSAGSAAITSQSTTATGQLPPTPVSATLADELQTRGHELMRSGQYAQAMAVLRRALAATGESVGNCVEPTSESCLTYAYALYDLGRALRLSGNPAAAVPVLQQRMQIDNQRDTVQGELQQAQQEAP